MHSLYDNAVGFKGASIQALSGTTPATSDAIDTMLYKTGMAFALSGAVTGTPDSFSIALKIQDSPDGTNDWQDVNATSLAKQPATASITAANTLAQFRVSDYLGVDTRRYIRVRATPAFVGGTGPTAQIAIVVALSLRTENPGNTEPDVQAGSIIS